MATAQQLKALRKKYKLGEYSAKRKVFKSRSVKRNMAKKRVSRRRGSSSGIGGVGNMIFPILLAYGYESFVSPRIPLDGMAKNVVEAGLAFYLSKKGGIVGNTAKVVFTIEAFNLISQFAGGVLNTSSGSGSAYY